MAEVTKNVLKGYFTKGSVPTQSNYADLVDTLASKSEMNTAISGVNQSVTATEQDIATIAAILGKGQNETLTQLAAKFTALTGNYANVYAFVSKVKAFLEDADATDETINRWQEIESFLQGVTDSDSLTAMLADLKTEIEDDLAVDSTLSSTSENALQNKVLYNELRVTESGNGAVLTIDGTSYPIVELDADTFPLQSWTDSYYTDHSAYIFPTLDPNKAYIVHNTVVVYHEEIIDSNGNSEPGGISFGTKCFAFSNQGTFIVKFDTPTYNGTPQGSGVAVITSDEENQEEESKSVSALGINANQWTAIPAASYFYTRDELTSTYNTAVKYYGLDGTVYDGYHVTEIPAYSNATETTGSTSTVKSLKQKIAELEARLAAVPSNYLEFATDMSAYSSAATGKVLLYLGATTQDFTHGYVYEKTANGWSNLSVSPVIN